MSVNQTFGNNPQNPDGTYYYARFKDVFGNPEKGHMGVDFKASHGQPVFAAHDGMASYQVDDHGGDGIHIVSNDSYDYGIGNLVYMRSIYWHLCSASDPVFHPMVPTDGHSYPVKAGDLIGYADNSGAPFESSGDHLHFGLIPCDNLGRTLHAGNGYNGCVDPMPYFNGLYAKDIVNPPAPLPEPPASLKADANNTTLTPEETGYFLKIIALIRDRISRLFS